MYHFRDNWVGEGYSFPTLEEAKEEAKKHTCGHAIAIWHDREIVAWVEPGERPYP